MIHKNAKKLEIHYSFHRALLWRSKRIRVSWRLGDLRCPFSIRFVLFQLSGGYSSIDDVHVPVGVDLWIGAHHLVEHSAHCQSQFSGYGTIYNVHIPYYLRSLVAKYLRSGNWAYSDHFYVKAATEATITTKSFKRRYFLKSPLNFVYEFTKSFVSSFEPRYDAEKESISSSVTC